MNEIKNIIFQTSNELTLVYCLSLSLEEIKLWCKKLEIDVQDIYEEKQENLQYYNIDGRVWCDTPEKEAIVRKFLNDK